MEKTIRGHFAYSKQLKYSRVLTTQGLEVFIYTVYIAFIFRLELNIATKKHWLSTFGHKSSTFGKKHSYRRGWKTILLHYFLGSKNSSCWAGSETKPQSLFFLSPSFPSFPAAHSFADIIALMMPKRVTVGQVQLLIVLQISSPHPPPPRQIPYRCSKTFTSTYSSNFDQLHYLNANSNDKYLYFCADWAA